MTDFMDRISKLSPKRLALLALEQQEQIEDAARRVREPLAIVGMGCRIPGGVEDPDQFWELLRSGRDAISEVPADRWDIDAYFDPDPDAPGKMSARSGGFLASVGQFDPAFFGIAPREALTMDPQQRLLLEVTWEALEHAGIAADRLAGSATGVFVGICNSDHFHRVMGRGVDSIDAYLASGNAHSVAAGRISYCLGLQGPALSIDTACSSSLVAMHVACRSLRSGEIRMALVGGVNVMCAPETTIALSRSHMLAPDGRCKTFDASADGFARGEGCGVLVLKRLSDALADGDRVLALVRGSAANQDGRSGGLTVPNGPAQEAVIRAALADAGVAPADIDYVEAHGTGTSLGDPIEVRALAGALGAGRPSDAPLVVGSVKTNIGHLESAAGVAGIIKTVLALQHERIPPHLHFRQPSPHIAWAEYPVSVLAQGKAWPRSARPRLAGVSSFGFSGTNAHVVLEEAPPVVAQPAGSARPLHCLPLSARSAAALGRLAARMSAALRRDPALPLADVALTCGAGRSHFNERLAVVACDTGEAAALLQAASAGESPAGVHRGSAVPGQAPEVVFLFTGQGSQYPGMSRELYETAPVFRAVIDRCDQLLGTDADGRTLKSVLWEGQGDDAPLHSTNWTQPALFAVEYGLAELWQSWGIRPAAVMGHSVGEYVAACVAGVFSLEDGIKLIAERGRLMHSVPPGGTMAALFAPAEQIAAAVATVADRVGIAAINAPDSVVISGQVEAVDALLADFERRQVRGHRLFISLAAHSPLMEPALDAMEACAASVTMHAPRVPVAWNVTGGAALPGGAPDARYWRRHLRETVRFADGVKSLYDQGYRTFLEVGPHPTLIALAQRFLPEAGVRYLTSLRRGKEDWSELLASAAELHVQGAPLDWAALEGGQHAQRVALPTYPFERRSYWLPPAQPGVAQRHHASVATSHDRLLCERLPTAVPLFAAQLRPDAPAYLGEHLVHGMVLVAGPVFLELAQQCARDAFGVRLRAVERFAIREPLVLEAEGREVQVQMGVADEAQGDDRPATFAIHSRAADGSGAWTLHATGRLVGVITNASAVAGVTAEPLAEQARRLGPAATCDAYYEQLAGLGIQMGAAFRSLREAHRRDGEALARIELAPSLRAAPVCWAHPALLDGALQAVGLAAPRTADNGELHLLTGIERIVLHAALPATLWCHARLADADAAHPGELRADITLRADDGTTIGSIEGMILRRATRDALRQAVGADRAATDAGLHYSLDWEPAASVVAAASHLAEPSGFESGLRTRFAQLAGENRMAIYDELLPQLDRLSAAHVIAALQRLGFDDRPGRRFAVAEQADRLTVLARHRRLFARMLQMLAEDGFLRSVDGGAHAGPAYEIVRRFASGDAAVQYDDLLRRFGAVNGELLTLRRCATHLGDVLRGSQDPIGLLFPGGSLTEARQLYVESPYARTYNAALADALRCAIERLPANARLRILEIGAGTGGTTTYVLPLLPAARTEYVFTDISPLFLDRAAEQFAQYPFVQRALLDIERDPATQGFEPGRFDIVIAANVLHATADLRKVVQHAHDLIAPGGLLLLLEGVAPERWVDLTFGLTEGWWRFTDTELRPDYPLVSRESWSRLLGELGFIDVAALPDAAPSSRGGSQQALVLARKPRMPRRFAVVGDGSGLAATLAARLRQGGHHVDVIASAQPAAALASATDVIYLGALDIGAPPDLHSGALACEQLSCDVPLSWMRTLAQARESGRLWLVTRGAQHVVASPGRIDRWQAPLCGLGRGFALEQPGHWGAQVDLDPQDPVESAAAHVINALDAIDLEDQVAWRGGQRYCARVTRCDEPVDAVVSFRSDATYMITGGFGGLGLLVARWMAEHGARHIALVGRHPGTDVESQRAIEALGTQVIPVIADLADVTAMSAAFDALAARSPPLRGIVHAAAALNSAPVASLGAAQLREMLRPKLHGTLVLERLALDLELDFTVLFSSTTALLGASGLAHYAAANAFLDATAVALDRPGRRVLSVNWGTWDTMRLASADDRRAYREGGLEPMPAVESLGALGRLLAGNRSNAIVARIDWDALKALHEVRRPRPLLARMGNRVAQHDTTAPDAPTARLEQLLAGVPEGRRLDAIVDFVSHEVATVLGLEASVAVSPDTGLFDLGMDSLMSVELRRRLEQGAGRALPSTLTFNYPNVAALAGFLHQQLHARALEVAAAAGDAPAASAATTEVVPHAASDLDSLTDDELEARLMARLRDTR